MNHPEPSGQTAALNRLTAACELAAPALKALADMFGDELALPVHNLLARIRAYQDTRTDVAQARDLFLSRFPDAQTMQAELDRRHAERQQQ